MDSVKRLLIGSFLVVLGSLACVQVSFAQANPLNFGNNFFVTGDYVVAGAQGMTTNFSNGYAIGTFTIPDANPGIHGPTSVPAGAEVMAAFLYWQTVEKVGTTPGQAGTGENGYFRPLIHSGPPAPGYPITGVPLPGHNAVSWSQGGCSLPSTDKLTRTYRANVLGALPQDVNGNILANGQFEVRLPSVGPSSPLTLGASLVIIYRILSPNVPLNSIVIYDGAYGQSNVSLNMTQTVQGFYDANHNPVAKLTLIAGAGKSKESQSVSLNSIVLPSHSGHGLPPFPGYYGSWDNPTWTFGNPNYPEIANPVLEDSANATVQVVPTGGGCVSWGTVILSTTVKNSDGDGLLNVWKAPKSPNSPLRPGYCDASVNEGVCTQGDANWVDLPQATPGHKDVFVQLDYICSTPTGADSCTPTNGTDYSFDPRPSGAIDKVTSAFAAQGITLHVNPPTNMPEIHAIQEQACTDIPGPPLELCAFPKQPGVVTWKGGYFSIKNQLIDPDSPLDLNDCATSPAAADCIPRFQHGRKDSWHYVLFAHAVGTTQWRLQDGTLTSVKQTGNNVVFTTSTAIGTLTYAGYDAHGNPILDPTCSFGRVTIVGAGTNSNLNGTYCIQKQTNPGDTSFTIAIGGNATNLQYVLSTDPNLSVAIGQVNSASGSSDVGGEDSLIALGLWGDPTSITTDGQKVSTKAGTFMHELGHSIGLTHGGFYYDAPGSYVPTIETNCKPNHQSVMNYMFQVDLLDNGTGTNVPDYSGQTLTALNEAAAAVNPLTSPVPAYLSTSWYASTSDVGGTATPAGSHCDGSTIGPLEPQMTRVTRPTGSLSWKLGQDINFDGGSDSTKNPNTNEQLRGYDDWIPTITNTGAATTGVDLRQIGATGSLSVTSEQLFNDGGQNFKGGGQSFKGGGQSFKGGGQSFAGGGQSFKGGGQSFKGGGEIDENLVNTVTRSPRNLTATEDVSPRLIHLSWLAPTFGQIGSYKVYRSAHGSAFTVIATISGNPPATTYTDTVTCDPGGYQYFITAVLGPNSPNPGQESAPSNTVPASGQNLMTGCYALSGGSSALSVTGFASPAAGASSTQGDKVTIAVPVTDDFYPTNGTVPVTANKALVAIGPLPNDGNCPTVATVPVFLNYPGGPGAYPQPYTILSSGGSNLTNNNNQFTFNWDTTNFNAGCYVLEADFDSQQVDRTGVQVTIFESDNTPHILTTTLPTATAGIPYGNTIQESGGAPGALTWTISAGTFPPGLSIGLHSGTISGTATMAGNYNFTAKVVDSLGNFGMQAFTLKVNIFVSDSAPPSITPAIPTATAGIPYSNTIQQYGAVGAPTWSITVGAVPPGLTLNAANGTVSGTPTTAGNYNFTVQVMDSQGNTGSLAFTSKVLIFVSDAAPLAVPPYVTPNLPTATAHIPYSNTLYETGAVPGVLTWSYTGTLPPGLSLDPGTGKISGTPTTAGNYNFTVQVTDSATNMGSLAFTSKVLIFVSDAAPLAMPPYVTPTLPTATAGIPYANVLYQTGATGVVTWSYTGLPPGIAPNPANSNTLSGTPTTAGTFNFTAIATDSAGNMGELLFTLQVNIFVSDSTAPSVTKTLSPAATVGTFYSNSLDESGGTGTITWSITAGALPPGLSLGLNSGVVSGTPTAPGAYNFTVQVMDSASPPNVAMLAFMLSVTDAQYGDLIVVDGASTASPLSGTLFRITSTGAAGTIAAISNGSPTGVAVDANTGSIYVAANSVGVNGTTRVIKIDPFGVVTDPFITAVPVVGAVLQNPVALAVDGSGNVYVADNLANAIYEFDSSGTQMGAGPFASLPSSNSVPNHIRMSFDSSGNLNVASDSIGGISGQVELDQVAPNGTLTVLYNTTTKSTATYSLTAASDASGGNTTYTGTFSPTLPVGSSVTISGFSNTGNNGGPFTVVSCSSSQLVVNNGAGIAETSASPGTVTLQLTQIGTVGGIAALPDGSIDLADSGAQAIYNIINPGAANMGISTASSAATASNPPPSPLCCNISGMANPPSAGNTNLYVALNGANSTTPQLQLAVPQTSSVTTVNSTLTYSLTAVSAVDQNGNTTYTGTFSPTITVGSLVTIAGFTNAGNNSGGGTFTVVSCTNTQLVVVNGSGVSENNLGTAAVTTPLTSPNDVAWYSKH